MVLLRSELSNVEACAGIILNNKEIITHSGSPAEIGGSLSSFRTACDELKQRMVSEVFGPAKDHVIRRYVQFHQAGLVNLSDRVFQQLRATDSPLVPGKTDLLVSILNVMEDLLKYIAQRFYLYFDVIHGITQFQSDQISNRFRTQIEHIAPMLEDRRIEPTLTEAFLRSMEECLDNLRVKTISLEQQNYLDHFLRLVELHLEGGKSNSESFAHLLYHQNFNSTYFEEWLRTEKFQTRTADMPSVEPVGAIQGITANRPNLDVLIKDWLADRSGQQTTNDRTRLKADPATERLPLILSVPQLALFVRLCYLEGCFQISNISQIMRFFTDHFQTKKQPHISLKSFGRAFYSSDQATAAMVRDFLHRMIGVIDKTYFPKT